MIGQPHNLVRHPDMPQAAFEDLWSTLRAGKSWTGYVKNRCKNGDHYWIFADVTPIREGGRINGYVSIRSAPDPAEKAKAEALYKRMQSDPASAEALLKGRRPWSVRKVLNGLSVLAALLALAGVSAWGRAPLWLATRFTAGSLLLAGALLLRRSLTAPLSRLTEALQTCDLRTQITPEGLEELQDTARAFNLLNGRSRRVIRGLSRSTQVLPEGSATLSSTSERLTQGSAEMSQATENQEGPRRRWRPPSSNSARARTRWPGTRG